MSKKIIIVGGVAGGASAAARLRRINEEAKIVIFEKGDYISFANCGLPYYIGGKISERNRLLVQTPAAMEARFDVDIKIKHEVTDIDRDKNEVIVKNLANENIFCESYDFLILSPGAEPLKPPIEGINVPNVFTLRTIPDTDKIKTFIEEKKPENAVVVGGGFIGLEMVENLKKQGINVSLVEMLDQVMSSIDYEMAAMVHNQLRTQEVNLHLNDGIKKIEKKSGITRVILQSNKIIETEMVIMAVGVKPASKLAKKAGLEIGFTGGIKVNEYLQTSDKNIYAIGDAIEIKDFVTGNPTHIPLAGPANKQGRIVADNIEGREEIYQGTQGTSIAKVFDLAVGSTGTNVKQLKKSGIEYQVSYTNSKNHAGYYPGAVPMTIKIIFTPEEGKLLGAQIVGYDGVSKRIDVLSTSIRHEKTIFDLQELELAYAPPFGSAKDPVNMAGFAAGNIINNDVDVIYQHQVDDINDDSILLDVRQEVETKLGMIEGAINIPLNTLRDRLNELDKGREIVVYCAVGLRGYIACRILGQHGFENVKNLAGGYKLYSAVQDDQKQIIEKPGLDSLNTASNPEEGKIVGQKIAADSDNKRVEIDASGLQCPGPIMQVYKKMEELEQGDILDVTASDPGFKHDIKSWCKSTDNTLLKAEGEAGSYQVSIQKGTTGHEEPETSIKGMENTKNGKTMVVFNGDLDKAIASFIIANGAAAMGNKVTMFFTFWGLNILRKDQVVDVDKGVMEKMFGKMMPRGSKKLSLSRMNMFGMGPKLIRRIMKDKGVDSLEELIDQAKVNGVHLVACQMTMDMLGIKKKELVDGVEIGGVATFLGSADESNMSLFI